MTESTERLLAGRYRLIERIGRGGMGTVWWARDEIADLEVAVKEVRLPSDLDERELVNVVKRTHREALAAGQLHHPNLVTVYDVVVDDGRPWLIMEYIAARSLEQVFSEDAPLSPGRVAEIGLELLAGLRVAHQAGIVHRDVKPGNVLLSASGRVVLTDFGIATWDGATTLTQSGTFMGSPGYVAPEVARGERATPASDLWSLGATLYAAVEGRPPYNYDTAMATLGALITSEPDPPRRAGPLRPALEALIRKDPVKRASADRTYELLTEVVRSAPATPPLGMTTVGERPGRGTSARAARLWRHPILAVTGGCAALAIAAGLVLEFAGTQNTAPGAAGNHGAPSPATMPATPLMIHAVGHSCRAYVTIPGRAVLFDGQVTPGTWKSFTQRPLRAMVWSGGCEVTIDGVARTTGLAGGSKTYVVR